MSLQAALLDQSQLLITGPTDVVAAACHNSHYSTIWRTSLGIGVVFPLILFVLRLRLKEPEEFAQESMRRQTPYWLVLRFYWFRLACVSLVWFLYNVSNPHRGLLTKCLSFDMGLVLFVCFRNLLFIDPLGHLRRWCATDNGVWLEHSHQHVLPAWNTSGCICQ